MIGFYVWCNVGAKKICLSYGYEIIQHYLLKSQTFLIALKCYFCQKSDHHICVSVSFP